MTPNSQAITTHAHTALPLHMAVPLPSNPPRRPWPSRIDPRRQRVPQDANGLRCPGSVSLEDTRVAELASC